MASRLLRQICALTLLALACASSPGSRGLPNRDLHGPPDFGQYIERLEREERVDELDPEGVIPTSLRTASIGSWSSTHTTTSRIASRICGASARTSLPEGGSPSSSTSRETFRWVRRADHKVSPELRFGELRDAGFELIERFDTHLYHDFEVWRPIPAGR